MFEEMNKLIKNITHVVPFVLIYVWFFLCTVGVYRHGSTAIVCRAVQVGEWM